MNRTLATVIAVSLLAPNLLFAAWWNPLTWKVQISFGTNQKQATTTQPTSPSKFMATTTVVKKPLVPTVPTKLTNGQIIKKVKPAVVYIETENGKGSGMIVSADGYVLSNAHVVQGVSMANISISSGETFLAKVTGRDEDVDIAILKIDSEKNFSKVDLGDSEKVEQGDEVFTLGFPFGIKGDVSFKEGTISRRVDRYLETSAEIHPGNSGGPLVNRYGQVVGINSAVYGSSAQGIQIGETIKLAIPINVAKAEILSLQKGVVISSLPNKISSLDTGKATMCESIKGSFSIFDRDYGNILTALVDVMKSYNQSVDGKLDGQFDFDYGYHKMVAAQKSYYRTISEAKDKINGLSVSLGDDVLSLLKSGVLEGLDDYATAYDTTLSAYSLLTNDQKIFVYNSLVFPRTNLDQSRALFSDALTKANAGYQLLQGQTSYQEIKNIYNSKLKDGMCEKVFCKTGYQLSDQSIGSCVRAQVTFGGLVPNTGNLNTVFTLGGNNFTDTPVYGDRITISNKEVEIISWNNTEIRFKPKDSWLGQHQVNFGGQFVGFITLTN
ncbi:MAG: hypothetical protein RLZZ347_595 [Candidatus Parcubacteria bacterium]|jgi:S1-C subfamily serine protease